MLKRYLKTLTKLEEEFHKAISKIYFETRKAVEFLMSQEKKKEIKNYLSLNYDLKTFRFSY